VNFKDLAIMKNRFFSHDATADLDGSGYVNFTDLALLKKGFFKPPGPSGIVSSCVPAPPPCSVLELTPLLTCGTAACFEPGTPVSCIPQSCASEYETLTTQCRDCVDGVTATSAAQWLDAVVPQCAQ
jgi:hypothetical protein